MILTILNNFCLLFLLSSAFNLIHFHWGLIDLSNLWLTILCFFPQFWLLRPRLADRQLAFALRVKVFCIFFSWYWYFSNRLRSLDLWSISTLFFTFDLSLAIRHHIIVLGPLLRLWDWLCLVGNVFKSKLLFLMHNNNDLLAPDASEVLEMRLMRKSGILEWVLLDSVDQFRNPAAFVDLVDRLVIVSALLDTRTISPESLWLLFLVLAVFVRRMALRGAGLVVEHPFGLVEDDTVVIKLFPHAPDILPH